MASRAQPPAPEPLSAGRHRRRRAFSIAAAIAGAAAAVVVLLALRDGWRVREDVTRGKQQLTELDLASVEQSGGLSHVASEAAAKLQDAAHRAKTSPWLSALSYVPFVDDQVEALRDLSQTASDAGMLGVEAANDVQDAMDDAAGAGPSGRLLLIDRVTSALDRLESDIEELHVGAGGWLLPPVQSARSDLVHDLDKARHRLDDGRTTLAALRAFLAGPRRYLVLGGNNAEMRTLGIATTSGVASIQDGAVNVGPFLDSGATVIDPGVRLPSGWDWLYGYLSPDSQYANTVASANFPLAGAVSSAISDRNVHGHVDGVIYVDVMSLQTLLSVVGPVEVDGVTYDGDNAASILVNENYLRFGAQDVRREAQGKVATALFDALNTRSVSLVTLVARLQELASGRHLLAWSSIPSEQQLWEAVGADGTRSPSDLLVATQEMGSSKLDFYVRDFVDMHVSPAPGGRRVDLTISVMNPLKGPKTEYIDGAGNSYAAPGEYGFYLTVFLPRDAFNLVNTDSSWKSWARDGDLQVTTFVARVADGGTRTINLSFDLPASEDELTIVPSARMRPTKYTWNDRFEFDLAPFTFDLRSVDAGPPPPLPGWLVAGLLVFSVGAAQYSTPNGRGIGWWLTVVGVAMIAVQMTIYATW